MLPGGGCDAGRNRKIVGSGGWGRYDGAEFLVDMMEVETTSTPLPPPTDRRPHMPEPPVVRVEAIEDVAIPSIAGLEREMDGFYVGLLAFERLPATDALEIVYKAENVLVRAEVVERPPERNDLRPMLVQIPHLVDFIRLLNEREIEYEWQRGLAAGTDRVLLRDPSGNWISVGLRANVR